MCANTDTLHWMAAGRVLSDIFIASEVAVVLNIKQVATIELFLANYVLVMFLSIVVV